MPLTAQEAAPFAFLYASGFMAHPTDESRRNEFLHWVLGKIRLETDEEEITVGREEFAALVAASDRGVGNDLGDAAEAGMMAGEVLLFVLQLQAASVPDAGLDKAQHMASQFFKSITSFGGDSYRAGRETVANNWKRFRPVAHLWGAYSLVQRSGPSNLDVHSIDGSNAILGVAATLLDMAERCLLPRINQPLLSRADAWELTGVTPWTVTIPPLSAAEREWLGAFQPRFR
jgi:hypothetical protein